MTLTCTRRMALTLCLCLGLVVGGAGRVTAAPPPTAPADSGTEDEEVSSPEAQLEGGTAPESSEEESEKASETAKSDEKSSDESSTPTESASKKEEKAAAPEEETTVSEEPGEQVSEQEDEEPKSEVAEAPAAPQAEEADKASPAAAVSTRRRKRDYSVPLYQQKRPSWALELAVAARSGFGSEGRLAGADPGALRAFHVRGEYQPEWFQAVGVFALGVSTGLYATSPTNTVTTNLSGLLSYGYQARYEARFIRNQWIVPTVGYAGEWVRYSLRSGTRGTVQSSGSFFGAMLLLSAFDEASAAEMYANLGVSRVYLLAEARSRDGGDSALTLDGRSYFFGLRFEF